MSAPQWNPLSIDRPIRVAVLGGGQRGRFNYGSIALANPGDWSYVAVAEPRAAFRSAIASDHGLPADQCFDDWRQLIAARPPADICFVTLPDVDHREATVAALRAGYHVFLEKPMATTLEDSVAIVREAQEQHRLVHVAHVLRYTRFYRRVKELFESGALGEVVSVSFAENVGAQHMAHSFVRGNWRRSDEACPMLLAKCCHDLDLLVWMLATPVTRVYSTGSLGHFRAGNAPAGAPGRCTDGCAHATTCPFDAQRIYLDPDQRGWPVSVIASDLSQEGRLEALRTGPYGRCVYACDNDVVDRQVVHLSLGSGATCVLTMHGHSHIDHRSLRIDGSRATALGHFSGIRHELEVHPHNGAAIERFDVTSPKGGHGGGDVGVMTALASSLRGAGGSETSAERSLESHLLAFAAEASRHLGRPVDMASFRQAHAPCVTKESASR